MNNHELTASIFSPQLLHVGIIFIAITFPVHHGCKHPLFTTNEVKLFSFGKGNISIFYNFR